MHLFFTALMFYTRLPAPKYIDHSADALNRATVFFPLIGIIVGGIGVATYWLGTVLFPPTFLPVLFGMVATVWVTGAFHEDGFADVCDGFGGGWTKEQILTIMKDSRLGTYGTIGLGLLLAVKFFALQALLSVEAFGWTVALKYVSAHSLSRLTAVTVIRALPYARDEPDDTAKAKPVAQGITTSQLVLAALLGLLPLLALVVYTSLWIYLLFLIPLALVRWRLVRFFGKWIGGYTGDCLGATQQLAEVIVYLSFVSLLWVSI
ncbi:adenosylcobinamide-GDP ribazoletransferase [Spirosoma taeanense]|uniref:Adenosylcobinamide-GDP ribazoletransferase n=1 Tax=Spirosoma taeanense TaxID=2735870 RepID=A0A6M5Y7D8_9BACT|nr:adenosylcobinamide-GDP ribazoletransferase [Spirosoma taeanense]QJW89394.1 adenosylcobinamide-GDP ribazoletransferase [Spirosoma taeanense]